MKFKTQGNALRDDHGQTVAKAEKDQIRNDKGHTVCRFRNSGDNVAFIDDNGHTFAKLKKNGDVQDDKGLTIAKLRDIKKAIPHPDDRVSVAFYLLYAA